MESRTASDALESMYLAHRDAVFRYLRAVTDNEDRAIDLTAVTFERAFAALRAGQEPGLGWLLRTGRNAAIDADRRARTAALFRLRTRPEQATTPSPEEQTLLGERDDLIHRAVKALPGPQRHAIALRYSTDLTTREIGDVIGKSAAATQKLIERGLARLKEELHDLA